MTELGGAWGAVGLKPSATGTKATCVAWFSPPGALWALGLVVLARPFTGQAGQSNATTA